ncbi:MAG: flagellar protein FlaG [Bermanella sp.]
MSDMKAEVGKVELLPHNPLTTASQVKNKVQDSNNSGNKLPEENVAKAAEPVNKETVENAVSKLNAYVQSTTRTLNFQVDDDSGKTVIKVYDRDSNQLIRQIPNELVLELARRLNEEEPSLLFEAQV